MQNSRICYIKKINFIHNGILIFLICGHLYGFYDAPKDLPVAFQLRELHIENTSIFTEKELQKDFCHFVGQNISMPRLNEITNLLTARYKKRGYLLSKSFIPEQQIIKGKVKLAIIEGFISKAYLNNSSNVGRFTQTLLDEYIVKLVCHCPLHETRLERYLLLINDMPGFSANSYLKASPNVDGGSELYVNIDNKKFDMKFDVNNKISRRYGDVVFSAGGDVNNLLSGSQTGIILQTTDQPDRMKVINFSHIQQLGSEGMKFNAMGQVVKGNPIIDPNAIGILDNYGNSYLFSLGLSYPLIRSQSLTLTIQSSFDLLNSQSTTKLLTDDYKKVNDRIRSLRISTNIEYLDDWFGSNVITCEVSKGLSILGASLLRQNNLSRSSGRSDYTKINFNYSRLQFLFGDWSILEAFTGQYSFDSLLSAEEFDVGGQHLGRGYEPSEITGDHGIGIKSELRYQVMRSSKVFNNLIYYIFSDYGVVWNNNKEEQARREMLTSGGLGIRAFWSKKFSGNIEFVKPITKTIGFLKNKDWRVLFSVQYVV